MEPDPQPKTAQQLKSLRDLGESAIVLPDGSIVRLSGPSSQELRTDYGATRLYPLGDHRFLRLDLVCSDEERLTWLDATRLALFTLHWDGPFPQAEPGSWIEPILRKGPEPEPEPVPGGAFSGGAPRPNGGDVARSDLISVTAAAHSEFRRNSTDPKAELKIKAVAILLKGFRKRWIAVRDWELVGDAAPPFPPRIIAADPLVRASPRWELVKDPRGNLFVRTWDADDKESVIKLGKVLFDILKLLTTSQGKQATWFDLQRLEILRSSRGENRNRLRQGQLVTQEPFIQLNALGIIAFDEERIRLVYAPLERSP